MTQLLLYDTAQREKREFVPHDPKRVTMYVCGPTVYARAHIGNARPAVIFDILFRLLRHLYGAEAVHYVRNITDIDDKIIAAAAEARTEVGEITSAAIRAYHEDLAVLRTLPPTAEPRATEYLPQMIAMTEQILAQGFAYEAEGHVLFHTAADADYGSLSGRSREEQIAGARVERAPYKQDPADFVLWKPAPEDQPGWDSPWGRGRPGWHLECSAMSRALLGEAIDIHGGGIDLLFPHHENECAQCRGAAPGSGFVSYWMHNGHLLLEGRKMAKSAGNIQVLDSLLAAHPGEVVRLALLCSHYRQPMDWTEHGLAEARKILESWRRVAEPAEADSEPPETVLAALADDLNTPQAIAEMHRLAKAGEGGKLRAAGALLGLLDDASGAWNQEPQVPPDAVGQIEALLAARNAARERGEYARADGIRIQLREAGIEITDTPQGPAWQAGPGFDRSALPTLQEEHS